MAHPDKVEVHLPERCSVCGRAIQANEAYRVVGKRQVFDVPEPKFEVTEHRIGEVHCCGIAQRMISTCRKQGRKVFQTLRALFARQQVVLVVTQST